MINKLASADDARRICSRAVPATGSFDQILTPPGAGLLQSGLPRSVLPLIALGAYSCAMTTMNSGYTGGCLCGGVRYEAIGEPSMTGHCYCADCRKASGSGFIAFMGFASSAVRFSGETLQYRSRAANGNEAVRNFCPTCGGLVFGGRAGVDTSHTIYAGSLDDPSKFHPKIAIFTRDRPSWAAVPDHLTVFETMPGL